jgi:hypothetical protein
MEMSLRDLETARDPATTAADLGRVASAAQTAWSKRPDRRISPLDTEILAAVAGNPNAAPPLLFQLAPRFPGQVVRNPALTFMLVEDPALLEKMPVQALSAILNHPEAPPAWLALAAQRPEPWVLVVVGASPRTPGEVLARLAEGGIHAVRVAVAGNRGAPGDVLARLARRQDDAAHVVFNLRVPLAGNPATPLSTLDFLAADRALLPYIAANAALPEYLFDVLAADEDAMVRAALATQARLPARLVRRLAGDAEAHVRKAVARHAVNPDTLAQLADHGGVISRPLAQNPAVPSSILHRLRHAPDGRTRHFAEKALAVRASTPT